MWATVKSWAPKTLPRMEIVGDSDLRLICKRELAGKANEVFPIVSYFKNIYKKFKFFYIFLLILNIIFKK